MIVYLFAATASGSPIKMRTMEAFTNIESLGRRIIKLFYEGTKRYRRYVSYETPNSIEQFVTDRSLYKVYFFDVDSGQRGKLVSGKNIWKAMRREEDLKKDITKAMLRE